MSNLRKLFLKIMTFSIFLPNYLYTYNFILKLLTPYNQIFFHDVSFIFIYDFFYLGKTNVCYWAIIKRHETKAIVNENKQKLLRHSDRYFYEDLIQFDAFGECRSRASALRSVSHCDKNFYDFGKKKMKTWPNWKQFCKRFSASEIQQKTVSSIKLKPFKKSKRSNI